jgi:tetratricopeptide (TPR) repeat protein
MAQRFSRKTLKEDEFVEAAFDLGHWIERHWRRMAIAAGAVVAVVLIAAAWASWTAHRREAAGALFGEGFDLLREAEAGGEASRDKYAQALSRFEEAAAKAGGSPLGEVVQFYRGVTLLRRGDAAEAARVLEEVAGKSSNPVLSSSAQATRAGALEAAGDAAQAEQLWRELSQSKEGIFPPDVALLSLGRLLQGQGRASEARQLFQQVVDDHPQSASAMEARRLLQAPQK